MTDVEKLKMDEILSKFNISRKHGENRPKIEINASNKVTIDGKIELRFSEPLFSEKELNKLGINMT